LYTFLSDRLSKITAWRPFFDNDAARRSTADATGVHRIYREVEKPDDVAVALECDSRENGQKNCGRPGSARSTTATCCIAENCLKKISCFKQQV
jgi:hypothetical protein